MAIAYIDSYRNMIFTTKTLELFLGEAIPWSVSGQLGFVMGGSGPTVMGGIGYTGYHKSVASWNGETWKVRNEKVDHARVSGLAVAVPKDLFDYC